jgi:hypothetical protein
MAVKLRSSGLAAITPPAILTAGRSSWSKSARVTSRRSSSGKSCSSSGRISSNAAPPTGRHHRSATAEAVKFCSVGIGRATRRQLWAVGPSRA